MKNWMNKILIFLTIVVLLFLMLFVKEAFAQVTIIPTSFILPLNLSQNAYLEVNLTAENETFDEIIIDSERLMNYTPTGKTLSPNSTETFRIWIEGIESYERQPGEENLTHLIIQDEIKINATNITESILLGTINITLNITLPEMNETEAVYFFKKCFIEGMDEYCMGFNISTLQDIIIMNETIENITYDVMMPYNLTEEFMESYAKILREVEKEMQISRMAIVEAMNQTMYYQQLENKLHENAMRLENYLKSPVNPIWFELSPNNMLRNVTGFSEYEFADAINLLMEQERITQKVETKKVAKRVSQGMLIQDYEILFVASTERVMIDENNRKVRRNVIFMIIMIFISAIFIALSKLHRGRVIDIG